MALLRPAGGGRDALHGLADAGGVARAHEARGLRAVAQEDERGPELHAEGAAEPAAAGVLDLDVPQVVPRERLLDERLRAPAVAAPGAAELEQRRARKLVDFLAR